MLGRDMSTDREPLPSDLATAHAMILAERDARQRAEALVSAAALEIERLKLLLARMRRERFGQSSERGARLIEQLELQLAELEEGVAEEEAAAEIAAPPPERAERSGTYPQAGPPPAAGEPAARAHRLSGPLRLPQVRRPGPQAGRGCDRDAWSASRGAGRWSSTCGRRSPAAACEAISQPPAPSHPIARGRAGPNLLALVLAAKYGQHLPLTRQSAIYAREGVEIDVSHAGRLGRCRRPPA